MDTSLFSPGDRVCVAVSGGADSTALLRLLLERRSELGVVLSAIHVEHGLRGEAGARDADFVRELAQSFGVPCEIVSVNTPQRVAERKESVEEAARNLRYGAFRDLLAAGKADKIATAHTLDDQAETVLMKLLRGAWTEGLSGIHPVVWLDEPARRNCVIRPLLRVRRPEIEAYLRALEQTWCEDETNLSPAYTRNRVRHELLPVLRSYNPQIDQILAHIAANARAEEQHWQAELARVLPQLLLEGRPVRGGGRRVDTRPGHASVALELARLWALDAGLQRRVLRAAAERCGATLDFAGTERLLEGLAPQRGEKKGAGKTGRVQLAGKVRVERSARELQFSQDESGAAGDRGPGCEEDGSAESAVPSDILPVYELPIPGNVEASAFDAVFTAELRGVAGDAYSALPPARIRAWEPGDRVRLRYSSKPKKVKEVLERMGVRGEERKSWPVAEWGGKIVWMRGVELADEGPERSGSMENRWKITEKRTSPALKFSGGNIHSDSLQ
jgi:tRNA(Ile)-lysidine synthase